MINAECCLFFPVNVFFFFTKNVNVYNALMVFAACWGDIGVRGEYCNGGSLSLEVGIAADHLLGLFFF